MDCIIPECVRTAVDNYCIKHQQAFNNLEQTFPTWQKAYGKTFSYSDYLERLAEDYEIGSGQWVIDVAEYLIDLQE